MYVALALPFRLIGADRTDPPASPAGLVIEIKAAATSSEQHAAKSRSARRNRQHMRERATCGHPCAQLASGLATSTGLDKVVFAKPEGRARIKSMERTLLSAALPHRTGRAVRSGYAEGGVRTHSRKDLGNGIRVYGLGLGEEAYGVLGYRCKDSGNKGLRVTEFFRLRVRIYGLRVRILPALLLHSSCRRTRSSTRRAPTPLRPVRRTRLHAAVTHRAMCTWCAARNMHSRT